MPFNTQTLYWFLSLFMAGAFGIATYSAGRNSQLFKRIQQLQEDTERVNRNAHARLQDLNQLWSWSQPIAQNDDAETQEVEATE